MKYRLPLLLSALLLASPALAQKRPTITPARKTPAGKLQRKKTPGPAVYTRRLSSVEWARKLGVLTGKLQRPVILTPHKPRARSNGNRLWLGAAPAGVGGDVWEIYWIPREGMGPLAGNFSVSVRGAVIQQQRIIECEVAPSRQLGDAKLEVKGVSIPLKPNGARQFIAIVAQPGHRDRTVHFRLKSNAKNLTSMRLHSCKITPVAN